MMVRDSHRSPQKPRDIGRRAAASWAPVTCSGNSSFFSGGGERLRLEESYEDRTGAPNKCPKHMSQKSNEEKVTKRTETSYESPLYFFCFPVRITKDFRNLSLSFVTV